MLPKVSDDRDDEQRTVISILRISTLGRLDEFTKLHDALVGRRVKLSVAGVRAWHQFSGLGLGPYDGCAVIVFDEPIESALNAPMLNAQRESESGATIFVLSTDREESLRDRPEHLFLYVTQLSPVMLGVATDRESMHMLLDRRAHPRTSLAFPPSLAEWK